MKLAAWLPLLLLVALLGVASCGGAGNQTQSVQGRGRLTLTITWPTSRQIPDGTNSIKIVAKVLEPANGPEVASRVVARPEGQSTSQVVLDDLPSVKVRVTATAYAQANATGAALATGFIEVNVPENSSVSAQLTLNGSGGGATIKFFDVEEGEVPYLALCTQGNTFQAQVLGLSNPAVTWSASGGGVIESAGAPNVEAVSTMKFHTGHVAGAFSITVRSAQNPSLSATLPFFADPITGSGWGAGSPYIGGGPDDNGKYLIRERLGAAQYLLTKSGSTYTGPLIDGQPGEMMQATLVSADHLTGFTKRKLGDGTLETRPFDYQRECFDTD